MAPLLCHHPPVWIKYWIQNLSPIRVSGSAVQLSSVILYLSRIHSNSFLLSSTLGNSESMRQNYDILTCRFFSMSVYTSALVSMLKPTLPECGLYLQITFQHIHVLQKMCTMDPEDGFSLLFFPTTRKHWNWTARTKQELVLNHSSAWAEYKEQ